MIERALACATAILAGGALGACSREASQSDVQASQTERSLTYEQDSSALPAELRNGALASASPAQIQAAVAQFGADAVVATLWGRGSDEGWLRVVDQVATGEEAWLALVPALRPGTDGGASETLHIAVSHALARNPRGVLRLIASGHEQGSMVCSMNDWEPTEADVAQFYAATIPAVEAIGDPELQTAKSACLGLLRGSGPGPDRR